VELGEIQNETPCMLQLSCGLWVVANSYLTFCLLTLSWHTPYMIKLSLCITKYHAMKMYPVLS